MVVCLISMLSGTISIGTLDTQYRTTGEGKETISTGNEAIYLTRYSTIARLVDSVQFNKINGIDPHVIDVYAVDCIRLSSFEHKPVQRNGSFNQHNHQIVTATKLDTLYLVANTTLNVSVNVTENDFRLNEPNCNLIVVIFDDYTQYQSFVNSASWTQAYRTICFNDSFFENVYISQSTNYYITMFIRAGIRVDRVDWQIEGIVISFNYSDSIPGCSLQRYDDSTCSISVDIFSDQGASEVCFYAVAETDEGLTEKIVIQYEPSSTRRTLLLSLPLSIVVLFYFILFLVIAVYARYKKYHRNRFYQPLI